jgi:protein phosphatase
MTSAKPGDTDEFPAQSELQVPPPDPFSVLVQVDLAGATHAGLVRPNNEDCYLVGRVERALQVVATNLPPEYGMARTEEVAHGMLVADGLGGSRAGEVASRLAAITFVNLVLNTPDWVMRPGEVEANRVMDRIIQRYRRVGGVLERWSEADPSLAGMATTMTLACSSGQELFLGHVGDSRAYLLRGGDLIRLTRDHTYAQELADTGRIGQQEVERHRFRHVLTRALGPQGADIKVDVTRLGLRDGDRLLLCTDGLTGMVPEEVIRDLLAAKTADDACRALIGAALAAGGKDNVTVVLARYQFPPDFSTPGAGTGEHPPATT